MAKKKSPPKSLKQKFDAAYTRMKADREKEKGSKGCSECGCGR